MISTLRPVGPEYAFSQPGRVRGRKDPQKQLQYEYEHSVVKVVESRHTTAMSRGKTPEPIFDYSIINLRTNGAVG